LILVYYYPTTLIIVGSILASIYFILDVCAHYIEKKKETTEFVIYNSERAKLLQNPQGSQQKQVLERRISNLDESAAPKIKKRKKKFREETEIEGSPQKLLPKHKAKLEKGGFFEGLPRPESADWKKAKKEDTQDEKKKMKKGSTNPKSLSEFPPSPKKPKRSKSMQNKN
jgi:hypothetical protein